MTVNELEQKLGFTLPPHFRIFLEKNPDGFIPDKQLFIKENIGDVVQRFYSAEDLWLGWQNTSEESYMREDETMIITELLGADTFTVGVGTQNADVIYYLDWHQGLTVVCENVNQLLDMLLKERPT